MGGRVRRLFVLSVLALSFLSARFTWAANTCPWLNESTAAGFLGGSAIGTYVSGTGTTASRCTFVDSKPDAGRSLVITVEASPRSHERLHAAAVACSASSQSVAAVGNEAFRCGPGKRMVSHAERIVGRVRDQVFSVNLVSTMKQDPILTSGELEMRIYSVAEEVAGNLFYRVGSPSSPEIYKGQVMNMSLDVNARKKRWLFPSLGGAVLLWLAFVGYIDWAMHQPPEVFGPVMMHMPMPAYFLFPFETMWTQALHGNVNLGDTAPDGTLKTLDTKNPVQLAALWSTKPVVLVFGSYT